MWNAGHVALPGRRAGPAHAVRGATGLATLVTARGAGSDRQRLSGGAFAVGDLDGVAAAPRQPYGAGNVFDQAEGCESA